MACRLGHKYGQDDIVRRGLCVPMVALRRPVRNSHKYSTGEYNIHPYYVQNDGLVGVGGTTTTVSRGVYDTPYYSQRDPRWAGLYYGNILSSYWLCSYHISNVYFW